MRAAALAVALAFAPALAGCVSPASVAPASSTHDAAAVAASLADALLGVPCEAKSVGAGISENLKVLATVAVPADTRGRAELDPWNGWILTADKNGLDLIDARDPLAPREVELPQERGYGEAKWLANGSMIVASRSDQSLEVFAVDWTRPDAPNATSLGVWKYPLPGPGHLFTNMHMLETHVIAGEPYMLVAPNDDTGVWMVHVKVASGKAEFEALPPIGLRPLTGGPLGPHDMTIEDDAILHKPILYIANGFEGWQAFDVSDPKKPTLLAVVPNLDPGQGYLHTIAGNKVGDRRIVATISEVGVNTLKLFDATDFAKPILLAEWWTDKTDPLTPQHDINILDGKLYMAHYTKGVYVFDLKKLGNAPLLDTVTIAPVAHFAPAKPMDGGTLGFANVFDVVVMNGVLYVSDFTDPEHAVTAVGYGCLAPGDAALTAG
jgi:hypothetical protein